MIKSKLKKIALSAVLAGSSLMAGNFDYSYNSSSLVGIEGGYSSIDYEYGTAINNSQNRIGIAHAGLKIGAETKNYRVFLSGRYFYDSTNEYDYIATYGAEIQYKFNVTKVFDMFIGANGGIANMKWRAPDESFSRTISDPYFGGDIGANIHLGKSVDWEIGGRIMSIQATNTKIDTASGDTSSYRVGNIVSAYTSIIFKWKMD